MSHDPLPTIRQIEEDFENRHGPFSDVTFPEERLLDELPHSSMEHRATLVSIFATFDYNRDANQLVDNIIELHENHRYIDASYVPLPEYKDELAEVFRDIGFRYPSRDAKGWCKNNEILREKYSGMWTELLMDTGLDAPSLVERLNDDGFYYMKGVKIAPMYARIINDDVVELDNLWELDIPVDTHIRRLSQDLFERFAGDTTSDDEIREIWHMYGQRHDVNRHIVDGALWHIGNKWDDWGESYWESVTVK